MLQHFRRILFSIPTFVVVICAALSHRLAAVEPTVAKKAVDISASDLDFFETRIRPVLVQHCYECHAADSKIIRGGLLVDSREGIRAGGDSGPSVVPWNIEESLILGALRHETLEMPPRSKLPKTIVADFENWIARGAPDPRDNGNGEAPKGVDLVAARTHWAFQPIGDPDPPEVQDEEWPNNEIDRFVLRELELVGMRPTRRASKATLIRRATFDLIGLPPTVEEIDAFLKDNSPEAFEKVIERLLASPHYGERWGRHWLDLVRYADTNGADENHQMPEAWRFRDWVVRQLNSDLPLDTFITQQIAGDLLPTPKNEQQAGDLLTATGMLVIGPKMLAEQDKEKMLIDIVDEQVDTVGRTMLGLTIGCARCHDHKFDPISTQDYYALAGIFASTKSMANRDFVSKWLERPLPSAEITASRAEHQKWLDIVKTELADIEGRFKAVSEAEASKRMELEKLLAAKKEELAKLEKSMPQFIMAMATDEAEPHDLPVHIRGNHLALADQATPRGMPSILVEVAPAKEIPDGTSGRIQLADWLVSSENPLTARVMTNRIWMWHFGKALVRSPSNFGLQAEAPTHPELLDWLSQELMRQGWSMKQMHRTIMLSATYQMNSKGNAAYSVNDPENRLLWRQNRRRLEAEPIRDAILAVGGELDPSLGGKAPDTESKRRAIYLPINRSAHYEMFSTFDYVETGNHIEQRPTTTVPHQALFLLNSSLVFSQSQRIANELVKLSSTSEERVAFLFKRFYARRPSEAEAQRALDFLKAVTSSSKEHEPQMRELEAWASLARAMIAANEFVYID